MRVGIITSIPWLPDTTPEQCFAEALEEVELAEALGFDSVWFTEHHFALHGLCSGITTFLSAVAARTKKVRLGAAVHVLPYWNPLRLAEDLAILDILSKGRLDFGAGTGYRLEEFRGFSIPMEESREMGRECLDIILDLWSGKPVTFHGKHYQIDDVAVYPTPLQKPHPPVWHAGNSPETLDFIAERGYNWMAAATFGSFDQLYERRRHLDGALERLGRNAADTSVYAHVPLFVANSTYGEIKKETQEGVTWFFDVARWFATGTGHAGGTMYDTGPMARVGFDFDQFYEQNSFFGDPETCFRKIERFCRDMRPTDLVCLFKLGQPHKRVAEAMRLFTREVMPRVRQLNFD